MWINLGDSYGSNSGGMGLSDKNRIDGGQPKFTNNANSTLDFIQQKNGINKSLMLIPHRFAIRCIDELGLILRNDVIWAKRNGMPESVTDRFSKKHEFFFFFVKNQKYYFDLDGVRDKSILDNSRAKILGRGNQGYAKASGAQRDTSGGYGDTGGYKNPGDVSDFWDIPTQPSSDKHYATYNFDLIDKPIIAGCPEGGIILDPFAGTGTTILRAIDLKRQGIGIEGKKEYCGIFENKFHDRYGMFKEII